eukprot:s59_g14.t1
MVRRSWRGAKGKAFLGNALHGRLGVSSFVVVMIPGQLGSTVTAGEAFGLAPNSLSSGSCDSLWHRGRRPDSAER